MWFHCFPRGPAPVDGFSSASGLPQRHPGLWNLKHDLAKVLSIIYTNLFMMDFLLISKQGFKKKLHLKEEIVIFIHLPILFDDFCSKCECPSAPTAPLRGDFRTPCRTGGLCRLRHHVRTYKLKLASLGERGLISLFIGIINNNCFCRVPCQKGKIGDVHSAPKKHCFVI